MEKKVLGESTARQGRKAIERGLTFLEKDALKWREERDCATCHHGTMTVWAFSEAKGQGYDVDARALADMIQWTKDRFLPRSSAPSNKGVVVSVPLIYLGMMSQNLPILSRDELHRVARNIVVNQAADGAWDSPPPKNGPPPTWESRETLALLALLAWEPSVPADAQDAASARASRERADAWLSKTNRSETVQARSLRLLFDARRRTADIQPGIDALLKQQNGDGGWSQTEEMPSDAYATGQALYALSFADVTSDRAEIQRAISFLAESQREDGSWPMTSRGHPGVAAYANPVPITYFGAAWATLGLARNIPASPQAADKQ